MGILLCVSPDNSSNIHERKNPSSLRINFFILNDFYNLRLLRGRRWKVVVQLLRACYALKGRPQYKVHAKVQYENNLEGYSLKSH